MSTDRINQLHEEASERYLNGDYAGAIKAWRDVLGLDPNNEQAQGGVRMASQFVRPDAAPSMPAPTAVAAAHDVEHELEEGLKVLDGLDMTALLHEDGDDGATDRKPAPEGVAALEREDILDGWETPHAASADPESVGLQPVDSTPSAALPLSAAGAELKRRVDDLLAQAKAKADTGEREEALAVLARLAILDEDNAEATALRAKIEAQSASDLDKVETSIIEGVAALEGDRLDDAERHFQDALAISPEHREAKHYLEKVAERRASATEDLLGATPGESAPAEDAVPRAVPAQPEGQKSEPALKVKPLAARMTAEVFDPPPAASAPRLALPAPKVLLIGGVGLAVLVLAGIALPRLLGRPAAKPKVAAAAPAQPPARPAKPATSAAPTVAPPIKPDTPEGAKTVASALQSGRERMASGDFGGAVLAFNQALTIDPANGEAKAGFDEASEHYKASKAERDALNSIKLAFRDGEFTSGLRLAYRLPPSVTKSETDAIKLAGWYNLAVVAMRAGDCKGALSQLDEALGIAPADAESKSLRELASRYADAVKDRAFLDRVEALAFRPLPPS